MQEMGYAFSGLQGDKKFRSLKYRYKTIVGANAKSGRGRRKWEFFFEAMGELMAGDPSVKPVALISSSKVTSKPLLPKIKNSKDGVTRGETPAVTPIRAPCPTARTLTLPGRTSLPAVVTPTTGEP